MDTHQDDVLLVLDGLLVADGDGVRVLGQRRVGLGVAVAAGEGDANSSQRQDNGHLATESTLTARLTGIAASRRKMIC